MNRKIFAFLLITIFSSCSDLADEEFGLQPTELRVKVLDETFIEVKEATVSLYRDYYSFKTRTGEVAVSEVGDSGYAEFTNLEPYNYYIYATYNKGTAIYDNEDQAFNLFDLLTENAVTAISVAAKKRRDADPSIIRIEGLEMVPVTEGQAWKNVSYDSIYGEVMLIRNYDYFLISLNDQDIVSKAYFEFPKKLTSGSPEFIYFDTIDDIEFNLSDLQSDFDEDPTKDRLSLHINIFTKKSDYNRRAEIYSYDLIPTGKYSSESVSFTDKIVFSGIEQFPFPPKLLAGKSYNLNYDYLTFLNVKWL